MGLLLAAAATAALMAGSAASAAEDRHVRIINETDHTMVHFYASNTAVNSWQEDILGDDVVKPGGDVNINIDDGTGHCKFDFKAVFDNGESLIKHNVNVCEISSYRYTE
ncbi:MAG TPA: hypothetical protein VF459_19585 [Caulobacteraceae bacterium]